MYVVPEADYSRLAIHGAFVEINLKHGFLLPVRGLLGAALAGLSHEIIMAGSSLFNLIDSLTARRWH